jgi:tetratricopeptide (TPR) repeat protein
MFIKKYSLILLLIATLIFFFQGIIPVYAQQSVKVWEEPLVIPTYRVGKPDLNPIFYSGRAYQGAKGAVYPYPMLDKLTDIREEKTYRAVFLENEYVQICVLPEIGGRIFSALDKTNNYDFFYRQHVIKPALIGMLGAWISGGVEWNFPHHHRATAFLPVDYTLTENQDGSKTIWVGEIEIRHRMKWLIGLTLYPDSSVLEATIRLFNRTPFPHSFLCWANVAVHTNPDYQIIFPPSTEFATFHGKNQFSRWPISREVFNRMDYTGGVDVSWWKNHPRATSFFAWNYLEDFLAGYDHGKEAGVVHVADHHIVPGKKFWTWGTGERGQMWETMLTETDGPYIELMVGAYSDNQPDYSWLQPYEVRTFKQHWYPIKRIGGVKNANNQAALNLEFSPGNTVQLGFCTTAEHKGARIVLEERDQIVFEKKINISPQKPFWQEVKLKRGMRKEDLQLLLISPANEILISYRPLKKEGEPMPEPVKPPSPPEEIKSIEELYLTGLRLEQFHNPVFDSYPYYEEALKRDPDDSRANTALGQLYLKRGMFSDAEEKLSRAIRRITRNYTSPKDGEAFYYLGVTLRALGRMDDAYDAFFKAAWSQAWGGASYYSLAELASLKGDFSKALEFLDHSLSLNALNTKALNFKACLLRKLGRLKEAEKIAKKVLGFDPLDFWAGNEIYKIMAAKGTEKEARAEKDFLEIKMRDAAQSYLELAVDYGNCGFVDEAVEVLSRLAEKNAGKSSAYPMLHYYLGYYLEKKGEKKRAADSYQRASRMPADYCFPFRLESIEVLQRAQKINPGDARSPYYLGNLFYDLQPDAAMKEWEKSRHLDGTFPIVHRNLGLAFARVENNVQKAIASLEKAFSCNSKDARYLYELDLLYEAGGVSPEKRLSLLERHHETVLQRDDALSREIMLLVQLGKHDRAVELLATHQFHVWEGGGRIHNVYVDAYLLKGFEHFTAGRYDEALRSFSAALEYPKNLEVGRPYSGGRAAQVYYFMGTVHEAMGDKEQAKEYYKNVVAVEYGVSDMSYYQGLAFRRLGQEEKADRIFEKLIDTGKRRLQAATSLDFFAKFGERQSAMRRRAQAHYLLGLGHLGREDKEAAHTQFKKSLELNLNHLWAKKQLEWMDNSR